MYCAYGDPVWAIAFRGSKGICANGDFFWIKEQKWLTITACVWTNICHRDVHTSDGVTGLCLRKEIRTRGWLHFEVPCIFWIITLQHLLTELLKWDSADMETRYSQTHSWSVYPALVQQAKNISSIWSQRTVGKVYINKAFTRLMKRWDFSA